MTTPGRIDGFTSTGPLPDRQPVGEVPDWLSHELFEFTSRFVEIDGHRVHHVDEGEGPVLLFVHGNMAWSFVYRDVIRDLSDSFRCVALDLPGFGLSTAADGFTYGPAEQAIVLDRFMTALSLTEVAMMVNDWGGPIGLSVAGEHPERFCGLIIANTWAWPVGDDPRFRRFSAYLGSAFGRTALKRARPFFNMLLAQCHQQRKLTRAESAQLSGPFRTPASRVPTGILVREINNSAAWLAGVEAGLGGLADHPVHLLWGDSDAAFTAAHCERLESLFPRATTLHLPDAGNFVADDAPAEVAAAIRAWHNDCGLG